MTQQRIKAERTLNGQRVLLTGGARRIGREIALRFAQHGAKVVITYLSSASDAQKTMKAARDFAGQITAVRCDVRDQASISQATKESVKNLGGLDTLINNAGFYATAEWEKITVEQWDNIFAINTRGPFFVSRACAPELRKSKGRIINIGSLGGLKPWTSHAHYCQSKAALHMQTQILAKALAPDVAVNCVAPGMIDLEEKPSSDFMKHMAEKTPMKRNGSAQDIAAVVELLALAPHFLTGQIISVDGGLDLV